jgi:hypothetical protein
MTMCRWRGAKLISACHADTGDDSESHGPVWLGLIDEMCMWSVCEMSCVKHSLQWSKSEVEGKSGDRTETGDCR